MKGGKYRDRQTDTDRQEPKDRERGRKKERDKGREGRRNGSPFRAAQQVWNSDGRS